MHTIATCDEQNVMNKNISFHTRQHPKTNINFTYFSWGYMIGKCHIKINKINIKTFHLGFQCFEMSIGSTTAHAT